MNAVDTNVLAYFVDLDEPAKRGAAIELFETLAEDEDDTILPWQVAAEFLSCLRRWENEGRIRRDDTATLAPIGIDVPDSIPRAVGPPVVAWPEFPVQSFPLGQYVNRRVLGCWRR